MCECIWGAVKVCDKTHVVLHLSFLPSSPGHHTPTSCKMAQPSWLYIQHMDQNREDY